MNSSPVPHPFECHYYYYFKVLLKYIVRVILNLLDLLFSTVGLTLGSRSCSCRPTCRFTLSTPQAPVIRDRQLSWAKYIVHYFFFTLGLHDSGNWNQASDHWPVSAHLSWLSSPLPAFRCLQSKYTGASLSKFHKYMCGAVCVVGSEGKGVDTLGSPQPGDRTSVFLLMLTGSLPSLVTLAPAPLLTSQWSMAFNWSRLELYDTIN